MIFSMHLIRLKLVFVRWENQQQNKNNFVFIYIFFVSISPDGIYCETSSITMWHIPIFGPLYISGSFVRFPTFFFHFYNNWPIQMHNTSKPSRQFSHFPYAIFKCQWTWNTIYYTPVPILRNTLSNSHCVVYLSLPLSKTKHCHITPIYLTISNHFDIL